MIQPTTVEKYEVRNHWTGEAQFVAEINVSENMLPSVKLGLAIKWASKNDANLRSFKACLWMTLTENKSEVSGLIKAIKEGRIDGSKYGGDCACLVGTIANIAGTDYTTLHYNSSDPSEQWFMMISKGDKPSHETSGGFASKMALEWIEEWQAFNDEVSA